MKAYDKLYIDGGWVASAGTNMTTVENPCQESVIAEVVMGNAEDVDRAVKAARKAFPAWSDTPVRERSAILTRISEILAQRQDEIGDTIALEMGMPSPWARMVQAGLPVSVFAAFAQIIDTYEFEYAQLGTQVIKEPIGVCGFITPWNYPLHQITGKVAPALAAGCTMILKPSQLAPLNAFILAEVIEEAGVPAGVFNLVSGAGTTVGSAMTTHPDIDMISITGSTTSGIRVAQDGARTVKRVTLELGGKSANVLLQDADFQAAATKGVSDCFLNSGQTCSALTRMIVPAEKQEEIIGITIAAANAMKMGDAFEAGTFLGPMIDAAQQASVRKYIQDGIDEGARLVLGGPEQPEELSRGYYVKPTIFADVRPEMTIAREEIFGPVLCIMPYETEEEAVALANDSLYGLSGAVWSADIDKARAVARKIRTGQIFLNGAGFDINAPFGGYKQSGNGRERSKHGLEEFLEIKAVMGYNL